MIRVSAPDLLAKVDAQAPTWRARATAYTAELVGLGAFSDEPLNGVSAPDWSNVKPVFMAFQQNKCAYCERPLETAHEFDVEHFRPKGQVKPWNGPPKPPANGRALGYPWLAFNLSNYCVACKPCNSGLKSDYFPISLVPGPPNASVEALNHAEGPLLVFPFGDADVDPEKVIGWIGVTPVPIGAVGTPERARAETTIAFFRLDDRDTLERDRANEILVLWRWLDVETDPARGADERKQARKRVDAHLKNPKKAMRACLRAFATLARTAPREDVLELVDALDLLVGTDT